MRGIILLILLVPTLLAAEEGRIVGRWKDSDTMDATFLADGSAEVESRKGTWKKDGTIVFFNNTGPKTIRYKFEGDRLILLMEHSAFDLDRYVPSKGTRKKRQSYKDKKASAGSTVTKK